MLLAVLCFNMGYGIGASLLFLLFSRNFYDAFAAVEGECSVGARCVACVMMCGRAGRIGTSGAASGRALRHRVMTARPRTGNRHNDPAHRLAQSYETQQNHRYRP